MAQKFLAAIAAILQMQKRQISCGGGMNVLGIVQIGASILLMVAYTIPTRSVISSRHTDSMGKDVEVMLEVPQTSCVAIDKSIGFLGGSYEVGGGQEWSCKGDISWLLQLPNHNGGSTVGFGVLLAEAFMFIVILKSTSRVGSKKG